MPRGGSSRSGGGGRSSAGRSGSGRSNAGGSRGGFRGNTRGGNSGGSFGSGFTGGLIGGMMGGSMGGGRRHRGWNNGGWRGGPRRGGGCVTIVALLVIILVVLTLLSLTQANGSTSSIQRSTTQRTALPRSSAHDTVHYITDNLGWIANQTQVVNGLRNFHARTGVRPHLYITGDLDGNTRVPTISELGVYANDLYGRMFTDEAHLLFIFFENVEHEYTMYALPGNQARSVMDREARDILMDYIQRHYYSDLTTDMMFARAFDEASQRIMRVDRNPWIPVAGVFGILAILGLLFLWWKKKKAQDNLEHEQTQQILATDISLAGSDVASKLLDTYDDYDDDDNEKE